jgi:hypothetical protein
MLQLFGDLGNTRDGAGWGRVQQCFHPDARMTYTTADGTLVSELLSDCFEEFATDGAAEPPFDRRILSVTQAEDVASVLLEMHRGSETEDQTWVDLQSLLRIDAVWKDMNKPATHSSNAGWAAPNASDSSSGHSARIALP